METFEKAIHKDYEYALDQRMKHVGQLPLVTGVSKELGGRDWRGGQSDCVPILPLQ